MPLTNEQKKHYKSIGHHLKPVAERDDRHALIEELCQLGRCELVQAIGKMALIYRKNPKPNKQLSNIHRYQA